MTRTSRPLPPRALLQWCQVELSRWVERHGRHMRNPLKLEGFYQGDAQSSASSKKAERVRLLRFRSSWLLLGFRPRCAPLASTLISSTVWTLRVDCECAFSPSPKSRKSTLNTSARSCNIRRGRVRRSKPNPRLHPKPKPAMAIATTMMATRQTDA